MASGKVFWCPPRARSKEAQRNDLAEAFDFPEESCPRGNTLWNKTLA